MRFTLGQGWQVSNLAGIVLWKEVDGKTAQISTCDDGSVVGKVYTGPVILTDWRFLGHEFVGGKWVKTDVQRPTILATMPRKRSTAEMPDALLAALEWGEQALTGGVLSPELISCFLELRAASRKGASGEDGK